MEGFIWAAHGRVARSVGTKNDERERAWPTMMTVGLVWLGAKDSNRMIGRVVGCVSSIAS